MPRTNSGWLIVYRGRVVILDRKGRVLGDARVGEVRYANARFTIGAISGWFGEQRFMLSQGGGEGVPDTLPAGMPDLSRHVEAAWAIGTALEKDGARSGRPKRRR